MSQGCVQGTLGAKRKLSTPYKMEKQPRGKQTYKRIHKRAVCCGRSHPGGPLRVSGGGSTWGSYAHPKT